jgi:Cu/Ag efflux protein CusF
LAGLFYVGGHCSRATAQQLDPRAWNPAMQIGIHPWVSPQEGHMLKSLVLLTAVTLLAIVSAFAQSPTSGTVVKVDKANGTVRIRYAQPSTVGGTTADINEDFKVQEGLAFNALQPGDKIQFAVKDVDGKKTLTQLRKQ